MNDCNYFGVGVDDYIFNDYEFSDEDYGECDYYDYNYDDDDYNYYDDDYYYDDNDYNDDYNDNDYLYYKKTFNCFERLISVKNTVLNWIDSDNYNNKIDLLVSIYKICIC